MRRGLVVAAVAIVVVAGGAAWSWWIARGPSFAVARAREAVHDRLGAELTVEHAEVVGGTVVFSGVRIARDHDDELPLASIDAVRVTPGFIRLLTGDVRLERVVVTGARLRPGLLDRGRADSAPGDAAAERSSTDHGRGVLDTVDSAARVLARNGVVVVEDARIDDGATDPLEIPRIVVRRRAGGLETEGELRDGAGRARWNVRFPPSGRGAAGEILIDGFPLARLAGPLPVAVAAGGRPPIRNGTVEVRPAAPGEPSRVTADLTVRDLWIADERLAERTVGPLNAGLVVDARLDPADGVLDVRQGSVVLNGIPIELTGRLRPDRSTYLVDLDVTLPTTECGRAMDAVPAAVLGPVRGIELRGTLGGRASVFVDATDLDSVNLSVALDNDCVFDRVPPEFELARLRGPFTHVAPGSGSETVTLRTGPGSLDWVPLRRVSPFLVHAVLAHEDAGFFEHPGIATYAVEDALRKNLERGEFAFGASTISMQLARNLFLSRDKTLSRKVREIVLTWWLESRLGKPEILELYLNVIEYGPDVYGLRSAGRRLFHARPAELTLAQSAYVATSLPAPRPTWRTNYEQGRLTDSMRRRMSFLVRHMHDRGRIDAAARDAALAEIGSFAFEPRESGWNRAATAALPFAFEPTIAVPADGIRDGRPGTTSVSRSGAPLRGVR